MPHLLRYRLSYLDLLNVQTTIDICERDYAGAVADLNGTDTPLVINWPYEDDRLEPIRGSEARIQFYSQNPYDFMPLFTSGRRKYLVNIYKGNEADDLLKNRGFYGSAADWTLTGYTFNPDTWSVKAAGAGVKSIKQAIALASGNYTIRVMCANVVSNTLFRIKYDGDGLLTGFLSDTGDATAVYDQTFNIMTGSESALDFEIETDGGSIEITEVQLYPTASPEFNHNLLWSGYLYPSVYQQSLGAAPHVVELTAACGLGQLDKHTLEDDNGIFPVGQMSLYKVLQMCLRETRIPLPLAAAIPVTFDGTVANVIKDSKFNTQALEELTCSEILTEFGKLFSGRFYQSGGMWRFARYEVYSDSIPFYIYDATRTHREAETFAGVKNITAPNGALGQNILCFLEELEMRVELPFKSVKVENTLGYRDNIVPGIFIDPYWNNNTPLFWDVLDSAVVTREGDALRMEGTFGAFPTNRRIKYENPITFGGRVKLKLAFKVFMYADDIVGSGTLPLGTRVRIGDRYLSVSGWSTNPNTFIGAAVPQNSWEDVVIDVNKMVSFADSDTFSIEIYAPQLLEEDESLYMLLENVEVIPSWLPVPETITTELEIDEFNEDIADVEVLPGISPPLTSFPHRRYLASILADDEEPAADLRAHGNVYKLAGEMIADDYLDIYSQPREILTAQVHGYVNMNNTLRDTNHGDKLYVVHALSIYDKQAINEVELYEQP